MKIMLILPYFGAFPSYFQLTLNSIGRNPDFEWLLLTDNQAAYEYPENVKKVFMEFEALRAYVQRKFPFPAALDSPYKLCDFKPAFGYLFGEYIKGYDFWGHCDLDVIWGDLNKFITQDLLNSYELLYREGALRLYKNCEKVNRLFEKGGSIFHYREVFSSKENYGFDEALGIQRIAERSVGGGGKNLYRG